MRNTIIALIVTMILLGGLWGCRSLLSKQGIPTLAPERKINSFTPQITLTSEIKNTSGVLVLTDQREYRRGDTVAILVRNETDHAIWYSAAERFWILERLDLNNQWVEVNFSFPLSDPLHGAQTCIFIVYERPAPSELKPHMDLRAIWLLTKVCEWPLEPVGVPISKPKLIAPGTYRVVFIYGLSSSYAALSEKKVYSDPIVIR